MNNVTLVGRVGNDPEIKENFVKLSLATNDGYGDNKKTNWHSIVFFGKAAEVVGKYVKKGDSFAVSGRLDYNKHEDKYYTSIIGNDFTLLGTKDPD